MRVPLMTGLPTSIFGPPVSRSCPHIPHRLPSILRSEQPPLRLSQLLPLVEVALHPLLLFVAIVQDFADGRGYQPEGRVLSLPAPGQSFSHPVRIAFLSKDTQPAEHVDQA